MSIGTGALRAGYQPEILFHTFQRKTDSELEKLHYKIAVRLPLYIYTWSEVVGGNPQKTL